MKGFPKYGCDESARQFLPCNSRGQKKMLLMLTAGNFFIDGYKKSPDRLEVFILVLVDSLNVYRPIFFYVSGFIYALQNVADFVHSIQSGECRIGCGLKNDEK